MSVDEKIDLFMGELIAVCIKDEPMEKINRFISVLESTIADKVHVEYVNCTTISGFIERMARNPKSSI